MLQKTYTKDHLSKCWKRNKEEFHRYYVKNSHEAIIDRTTFERVQNEIARRTSALRLSGKSPSRSAFGRLIVCAGCGKPYHQKNADSGGKYEKAIWTCGTYNHFGKGACNAKQLSETILLNKVCTVFEITATADITDEVLSEAVVSQVEKIIVSSSTLEFILKGKESVTAKWQNASRPDSWTPAMREKARTEALARHEAKRIRDSEEHHE